MKWTIIGFSLLFAGCAATVPTRIVTTPNVCPAPRQPPVELLAAARALPKELPTLSADVNPDAAAVAILVQRQQSAEMYQKARVLLDRMATWFAQ